MEEAYLRVATEGDKAWYKRMMSGTDGRQYIYMCGEQAVGQVHVMLSGQTAEFGYSICLEKRCMGHLKHLLRLLRGQIRRDFPKVQKLRAKVKPNDIASRKAFMDAGYEWKYELFELDVKNDNVKERKEMGKLRGGISILYLSNNWNTITLYEWLAEKHIINLYSEPLQLQQIQNLKPDIIISYNYKYMISREIIEYMDGKIINLHISLLPWNRGANPNFWSFIDDTPKGVTIHQINAGLDKGRIICQREIFFDIEKETFESAYDKLNEEIVSLFKENCEEIVEGRIVLSEQPEGGSYHSMKDLEILKSQIEFQWSDNIAEVLRKYKDCKELQMKRDYYVVH